MFEQLRNFWFKIKTYGRQRSLTRILESLDPNAATRDQVQVLKELLQWLSTVRRLSPVALDWDFEGLGIRFLCRRIEDDPQIQNNLSQVLAKVFSNVDPTDFFVEVGLVTTNAFFGELMTCLFLKRMPHYRDFSKLGTITEELLKSDFGPEWLFEISDETLQGIAKCLNLQPLAMTEIQSNFNKSFEVSHVILTSRIVSLAASSLFTSRVSREQLETLVSLGLHVDRKILKESRLVLDSVYKSLEYQGVSVELVFLIERIKTVITRLDLLLAVRDKPESARTLIVLFARILIAQRDRYSLAQFLNTNLALISKNIVERNTISGDKYIARDPNERRELFLSAAGGGAIIAVTTLVKYNISYFNLPLFIEGLTTFINYTLSFFLLQFAYLTLATKTPALTASVLASKLIGGSSEDFFKEVRMLVRSGILAIWGNVLFCMAAAIVIDSVYFYISDSHIFSAESSEKYLRAHHPVLSLALWYAAFTGIVLWLGSAIGGWFENWFVFRGLPQAIEENQWLCAITSAKSARKISTWVTKNIMGIATSVALGFFLAFSTTYGEFLGLPLDVRHVTLAAGNIGFALVASVDLLGDWGLAFGAFVGLFMIGVLNFTVSLMVSFMVAGHARSLNWEEFKSLVRKSTAEGWLAVKRQVTGKN